MSDNEPKKKLVGPWQSIHGLIWLVGIVILATRGWWWPGILVLIAISVLYEALLRQFVPGAFIEENPSPASQPAVPQVATMPPPQVQSAIQEHRIDLLPQVCPSCNAPIRGHEVKWTGTQSANCPYCGTNLPMNKA